MLYFFQNFPLMPHGVSGVQASLCLLSFLAGGIHVVAPDHWMPLSLSSWQRQWGTRKTLFLSLGALLFHLGLGFAFYLLCRPFIVHFVSRLNGAGLFTASISMVLVMAAVRSIRFKRISEVLRLGSHPLWSAVVVLSLLGPCESLLPIMIKAHHLGGGYLEALFSFALGTVVFGLFLIGLGRFLWNHPLRLNLGVNWALKPRSSLPIMLGMALGLFLILKL